MVVGPQSAVVPPRRGALLSVVAVVAGLLGLAAVGGGAWLIALGGSCYYAAAGLTLLGTAVLLWRRSAHALHLFAALVLGTLLWAVVEIGFDWWQLVPRGDVVFLLGTVMILPPVVRRLGSGRWWPTAGPLLATLVLAAVVGLASAFTQQHE